MSEEVIKQYFETQEIGFEIIENDEDGYTYCIDSLYIGEFMEWLGNEYPDLIYVPGRFDAGNLWFDSNDLKEVKFL